MMPERRSSSVTSFMSNLHFSGKVIMASVLFGFGLLLVGAILLIIATAGQKVPPLRENAGQKTTPMTFVGPGVMGVGGFFVIVGTIMCLFETRILRRRKNTEHDSLVHSEILSTENASPPRTEIQDDRPEDVEETQVKSVQDKCPVENTINNEKESLPDASIEEKDYNRQLSTSTDKEKTQSFTASVYVEAIGEDELDENDNEEHFTSGSMQFSTPPEGDVAKISLHSQSTKGHNSAQSTYVTAEVENESSLVLQKENKCFPTVSEKNEDSLLAPKDNEIPLPVSNDSIVEPITTHTVVSGADLPKADYPVRTPESTEKKTKRSNSVNEDL